MYMGYWDDTSGTSKRISREIEQELYNKFRDRLPGYYEDTEWWKLVEQADKKPLEELVECPQCQAQNLSGFDVCQACGNILKGKECLNPDCKRIIPSTAASCPHCGTSQIVEVKEPWKCEVCNSTNDADALSCTNCGSLRGSLHPLSREYLIQNSQKADELSIETCTVELSDGSYSTPIKINTYKSLKPMVPPGITKNIPIVTFKNPELIEIFVDLGHRIFKSFDIRPEQMIATEVAVFIFDSNRRLVPYQHVHSIASIQTDIIQNRWAGVLEHEAAKVQAEVALFMQSIREELPTIFSDIATDVFDDLTDESKRGLVDNMLNQRRDITELENMRNTGDFLRYIDNDSVIYFVKNYPERFFDGSFWSDTYKGSSGLPEEILSKARQRIKAVYINCLEDISTYQALKDPEKEITMRARASLAYLQKRIA